MSAVSSPLPSAVSAAPLSDAADHYSITRTIGNGYVADRILKIAGERFPHRIPFLRFDPQIQDNEDIFYLRDMGVLRNDGTFVAPYPIQNPRIGDLLFILLYQFRSEIRDSQMTGYGFEMSEQEKLSADAQRDGFNVYKAQTCVEGGNSFVFIGKEGRPRAIVGNKSAIVSCIALAEQGFFAKNWEKLDKIISSIETPDNTFVFMARAFYLFTGKFPSFDDYDNPFSLHGVVRGLLVPRRNRKLQDALETRVLSPLADSDYALYGEQARILEAMIRMSYFQIAQDLGIQVQDFAIYRQRKYHADLELAVDERASLVYLQSQQKCLDALNEAAVLAPPPLEIPKTRPPLMIFVSKSFWMPRMAEVYYYDPARPSPPKVSAIQDIAERWSGNIRKIYSRYIILSHHFIMLNAIEPRSEAYHKTRAELYHIEGTYFKFLKYYSWLKNRSNPYEEQNRRAIEHATGFRVVPVPGAFETIDDQPDFPESPTHNCCFVNGIFESDESGATTFISNGGDPILQAIFEREVRRENPALSIAFIPRMDYLVTTCKAGVRCLVRETVNPVTHL